jgi:hypothetical protein
MKTQEGVPSLTRETIDEIATAASDYDNWVINKRDPEHGPAYPLEPHIVRALCDLALQSLPAEPRQTELLCPTDGRPCWPTDAPRYEVELCAECPLHAEWHQPGASPVSPEQRSGNLDNAASGASTDTEATP